MRPFDVQAPLINYLTDDQQRQQKLGILG